MNFNNSFKIVLLGDSATGKSSIMNRYTDETYLESFSSTIGVDFKIKTLEINNETIKLHIWDTAGQEKFKTIASSYYRSAHVAIIVYDITDETSFNNVMIWYNEIKKIRGIKDISDKSILIYLVGNKIDLILKKNRVIPKSQVETLANDLGIKYIETSAKTGENIQDMFDLIVIDLLKNNTVTNLINKEKEIMIINNIPVHDVSKETNCC